MKPLKRSGSLRRSPLRKRGVQSKEWQAFRNRCAEESRNEEGLIMTEPERVGLPKERIAVLSPDLHHIIGRNARPDLYYEKSNLVWLTREQHERVHSGEISNQR